MAGVRKDLAKLGGPWADEILWYARAVGALRSRPLNDRTGWTYLAAMHGINAQGWIDQQIIPQNTPAPSQDEMRLMFNQCQHAGWFFLPWHRGYLWSFEAIVADWIAQQGGPADWALPYWNYLSETDPGARDVPQEFRDATLPDGSDNPLAKATRGPATALGPQPWIPADINLNAQAQRGPDSFPFNGRKDSAEGTLSVSDALRVFSIRTLVATKNTDSNKQMISNIIRNRESAFLSTDFIF